MSTTKGLKIEVLKKGATICLREPIYASLVLRMFFAKMNLEIK